MSIEEREQKVYDVLSNMNIEYDKREHPAVYTCEEADIHTGDMKGSHTKNLFLRNKKGNKHYLVIIEDKKSLNIKEFEVKIGEKNLSFASEERMMKYLGLTPGSVSLFGLVNDEEKNVKVIVDKDLFECEYVNFHPNVNTATLNITVSDMEKFLNLSGYEFEKIEM